MRFNGGQKEELDIESKKKKLYKADVSMGWFFSLLGCRNGESR